MPDEIINLDYLKLLCCEFQKFKVVRGIVAEFKSFSEHQLDLFQVVPGWIPILCLHIANWSAFSQLGVSTCNFSAY